MNQYKCNINLQKSQNSFSFNDIQDVPVDNFDQQRSMLAEERMKILKRPPEDFIKKTKIKTQLFQVTDEVEPNPQLVTYKDKLDIVVHVYSFILQHNLAVNISSELYFLISLLLSRKNGEAFRAIEDTIHVFQGKFLFESIHNVVYFSAHVLSTLVSILSILDRTTLKLLCKHTRLEAFNCVISIVPYVIANRNEFNLETETESSQSNVNFDTDTDNRENFPVDQSFHAFRKQRDLFYEILRLWELNHTNSNWNFAVMLAPTIKTLLNLYSDSANYRHMAKLFMSQLLRTCCKSREVRPRFVCYFLIFFLLGNCNVFVKENEKAVGNFHNLNALRIENEFPGVSRMHNTNFFLLMVF